MSKQFDTWRTEQAPGGLARVAQDEREAKNAESESNSDEAKRIAAEVDSEAGKGKRVVSVDDYFAAEGDMKDAAASGDKMTRLSKLAAKARELELEINIDTVQLEEKRDELSRILRNHIPDIMSELGMESLKMSDGSEISIKNEVQASIAAHNAEAAYTWLEENQFDGIIKTKVTAEFGKGEYAQANHIAEILHANGVEASPVRSIHAATLKSFVRERLEAGDALPRDVFGVFEFKQAKIKLPKGSK